MNYLISFIVSFLAVYLLFTYVITLRKKGRDKLKEGKQMLYFKKLYNIDPDKINMKSFSNALSLANAFIVASVFTIVGFFKNVFIQLIIAFIIIIPIMYITYKILGIIYQKKEGK